MSKLKIGYKNLLDNLTSYSFVVGTEDANNPFANCYDNLLFDNMTLTASTTAYEIEITLDIARTADYISFYKTNLAEIGGSIKLQYFNGTSWIDAITAISPTNTAPVLKTFTSVSSNKWKFVIDNNNTDATISDIKFGELISTEYGVYIGFAPPILAREIKYTTSKSDKGLPIGRSIKNQGISTTFDLEFMSDSYARSTWLPFIKHAEKLPFYVAWNYTDYPSEITYAITDGPIGKAKHSHNNLLKVNLKITGFVE